MAYAALVSGTLTLVATSPNLIINYEIMRSGVEGFNFFTFTPFGLPILAVAQLPRVPREVVGPGSRVMPSPYRRPAINALDRQAGD